MFIDCGYDTYIMRGDIMVYEKVVNKINDNKWYSNWKEFCECVDINYNTYRASVSKNNLLDYIEKYYTIQKDGHNIMFIKNNNPIKNVEKDKIEDELFHFKHKDLSKFFQASLIKYMGEYIKQNKTPSFIMSINYMLKSLNLISRTPSELNKKNIKYGKDYINAYKKINRENAKGIFEGGLNNLQNKGVIEYDTGYNISFKLCVKNKKLKDKYIKNELLLERHEKLIANHSMAEDDLYYYEYKNIDTYNNVFASNELKTALFNGMIDSWITMCDIFGFNDNKHDDLNIRINYGQLMDTRWVKWFKSNNRSLIEKLEGELKYEEYNELVRFYNSKMNYYDLFYNISKITTSRRIKSYLYQKSKSCETVEVDYYYKAYQVHINEPAIERYKDVLIERVLGNTPHQKGKKININYMANKMYNEIDKEKLRSEFIDKINLPSNNTDLNNFIAETNIIEQILGMCAYMIDKENESRTVEKYRDDVFGDVIEKYKSKI